MCQHIQIPFNLPRRREDGISIVFDVDCWYEPRRENHIFTYRKKNFIAFEVLNKFFYLKESEDKHENGIIGSDFELAYFLKLTENIAEFSFKLDTYYLKCILILLKCFEVVENRSLLEFLQSLFFYGLVVQKESLSRKDRFDLENAFHSDIFKKPNFSIQKSLCYTFLNMFMITFVFNDGNLIILEKANELYDILLFDKHIPYKNLLFNDGKAFSILEKTLKYSNTFEIFKYILNLLNINSIIIDNKKSKPLDIDVQFNIVSLENFKSFTISNFNESSSLQNLNQFSKHVRKDVEFGRLVNVSCTKYEKIKIRKLEISPEVYNWIFQKTYIKVIYIENYTPNDEPLTINNFTNNISLTKLALINVRIVLSFVNEIFKLQNLTKLSLESCIVEPF
ncbi:hypothetical protein CWI39_2252p0010, partial [Hamiltosporidium magnivora]